MISAHSGTAEADAIFVQELAFMYDRSDAVLHLRPKSLTKSSHYTVWAAIAFDVIYFFDKVGVYFRTANFSTPATTARGDALQLVDRQVAYRTDHDRLPLAFQFIAVKSRTEAHPRLISYDGVALLNLCKFLLSFVPC